MMRKVKRFLKSLNRFSYFLKINKILVKKLQMKCYKMSIQLWPSIRLNSFNAVIKISLSIKYMDKYIYYLHI